MVEARRAASAITVSSPYGSWWSAAPREPASVAGRAAAQLQRAGLLAHELLGLLHPAPGEARVLRRWAHGPLPRRAARVCVFKRNETTKRNWVFCFSVYVAATGRRADAGRWWRRVERDHRELTGARVCVCVCVCVCARARACYARPAERRGDDANSGDTATAPLLDKIFPDWRFRVNARAKALQKVFQK